MPADDTLSGFCVTHAAPSPRGGTQGPQDMALNGGVYVEPSCQSSSPMPDGACVVIWRTWIGTGIYEAACGRLTGAS